MQQFDCTDGYIPDTTRYARVVELKLKDGVLIPGHGQQVAGYIVDVDPASNKVFVSTDVALVQNIDSGKNVFAHPHYGLTKAEIEKLGDRIVEISIADLKAAPREVFAKDMEDPIVKNAKRNTSVTLAKSSKQSPVEVELNIWDWAQPYKTLIMRGMKAPLQVKVGGLRVVKRGTSEVTLVRFAQIYSPKGLNVEEVRALTEKEFPAGEIEAIVNGIAPEFMSRILEVQASNQEIRLLALENGEISGNELFAYVIDQVRGTYAHKPIRVVKVMKADHIENSKVAYEFAGTDGALVEKIEKLEPFLSRHAEEGFMAVPKVAARPVVNVNPARVQQVMRAFAVIQENMAKPVFQKMMDGFFRKLADFRYEVPSQFVPTLQKLTLLDEKGNISLETLLIIDQNKNQIMLMTNSR